MPTLFGGGGQKKPGKQFEIRYVTAIFAASDSRNYEADYLAGWIVLSSSSMALLPKQSPSTSPVPSS